VTECDYHQVRLLALVLQCLLTPNAQKNQVG